ncbi:hypothetical protein, partial [Salmonella sp. SAL4444]|uniref:hypothetical protein n=1 Tax=Salmonella sp. SAL4444 TaxID=3159899 RepID=UPI003979494A
SYAVVLDIIRTVLDNPHYVVYDMDTRDSVYALNGLYLIENYSAPSTLELQILERFDVNNYITGAFYREVDGRATLSMSLC